MKGIWRPEIGFISTYQRAGTGDHRFRIQRLYFRCANVLQDGLHHVGVRPQLVFEVSTERSPDVTETLVRNHADDVDGIRQVSVLDDIRPVERLAGITLIALIALLSLGSLYALNALNALDALGSLDTLIAPRTQGSLIALACDQDQRKYQYN